MLNGRHAKSPKRRGLAVQQVDLTANQAAGIVEGASTRVRGKEGVGWGGLGCGGKEREIERGRGR